MPTAQDARAGTPALDKAVRERLSDLLFQDAPRQELEGLSAEERERLVTFAGDLLAKRAADTHRIDIVAGEGGAGQRRTLVGLLTEDMPFLVDSANNAIIAEGVDVLRMLHPILPVNRNTDGELLSIGEPDAPRESLILLEIRRIPARQRAGILSRLDRTYNDLRAAVTDWQQMLSMLREAARTLNGFPPPIAPHVLAESIAFLDWLAADNFTLLGSIDGDKRFGFYRNGNWPLPSADSGLHPTDPVLVTKSPLVSTVHRNSSLDQITVRRYDNSGQLAGTITFIGLFASAALRESPRHIPMLRRKVAEVVERLGFPARSHAGRTATHVIDAFPREELFQLSSDELLTMASNLLSLQDRPRPAVFARRHESSGRLSVFAYVPRDDYTAYLREKLSGLIEKQAGAPIHHYDIELRAEPLARVHFVVPQAKRAVDDTALTAALVQLTRGWDDELETQLEELSTPVKAARLTVLHKSAFGPGYRAEFSPREAAEDILHLSELSTPADRRVAIGRHEHDAPNIVRVRVYRLKEIIPLSDSVTIFENFGFRVIEETPWDLAEGELGWIHAFVLELPEAPEDFDTFCRLLVPALTAVLEGTQENDAFNALIPGCQLDGEQSNWLRAFFRYLRQTGVSYGLQTAVDVLRRNVPVTRGLVDLFHAQLSGTAEAARAEEAEARLVGALDAVASIDDDRILRLFLGLVKATLRTNAFVPGQPEALAFKFDSEKVAGLPKPVPWREIWVYSPRVEGIHLRGGPIARGGLRWSDRRDDFRTEVLGLVKAQMVKNSVIVPTGAKGGFYAKMLPNPAIDREGWAKEGRESYCIFIRALLSITDNIAPDGAVIPPAHVTRLDGDDPYMVVAADKGTASFSDTANEIAENHGFWLGDAFASGGSDGYDHKAMGITARGAWVSVTRHFAELGIDVQTDAITVAGVGDMSGDVFGNGMLLSKAIRLVAAFDHRHIFLDPNPDPAASWAERKRLFELPRSSWADYKLVSEGGGIFPRSQKSIPLSPQVKTLLGITEDALDPSALMAAILKARVDLFWFGGIGTYVKSSEESNADVGDRANDGHRVNGADLRARIVGEGANLGMTQAGRIEFALHGGRGNTDFIDNSGGVDASDHEVNIKIALASAERAGKLDRPARNALLDEMTDEVARLVLSDNRAQTLALSVAETEAVQNLESHARLITTLEESIDLDRDVEDLPDHRDLEERARTGRGLTRPELAILLSYTKMDLKQKLVGSDVATDPLLDADLIAAFPTMMQASFADEIRSHPLKKELVSTKLANLIVNRGGLTLAHELAGELGTAVTTVASAFLAARTLFDLPNLWKAIDEADVPADIALKLHGQAAAVIRVLVGDIAGQPGVEHPHALALRLAPGLARLLPHMEQSLTKDPRQQLDALRGQLAALGSPPEVTDWIATLASLSRAIGIVRLADELGADEVRTAKAYTRLGEALAVDWIQGVVAMLAPSNGWERLLVASTTRKLAAMRLKLIQRETGAGDPLEAVEKWIATHRQQVDAVSHEISRARATNPPAPAMIAHLAGIASDVLVE